MSSDNFRVWPVEGDHIGDKLEYPPFAKYRFEPHYVGAAGDRNHDVVIYRLDDAGNEQELGRHAMGEVMIAFSGQPDPFQREGNVSVSAPAKSTKSDPVKGSK